MSDCAKGGCEVFGVLKREASVSLEQRIGAELWLKEYIQRLRVERPELLERVLREEKVTIK